MWSDLPVSTDKQDLKLPRHVAIILDGNGRWAKKRKLPRFLGHKAGVEAVRAIVKYCAKRKIEVLTLFAFSSENWKRPEKEVGLLMELLFTALSREVKKLDQNNVRLHIIGDRSRFNEKLCCKISEAEELTVKNTGLNLVIAVNYGGRWDITQATQKIAVQVADGEILPKDITPELLHAHLSLSNLPEPDLFIRTGGEQRVSNFLLWQLAYTEFFFTNVLWPDFDSIVFEQAVVSFNERQRRFGRTGDQVESHSGA